VLAYLRCVAYLQRWAYGGLLIIAHSVRESPSAWGEGTDTPHPSLSDTRCVLYVSTLCTVCILQGGVAVRHSFGTVSRLVVMAYVLSTMMSLGERAFPVAPCKIHTVQV
jgi:hypothetical protein